jgi:HPr kinase/phosphorylase
MPELVLKKLKVSELLKIDETKNFLLGLEILGGVTGLEKEIEGPELNRPGLSLAGFFEHFAYKRIQVFGKGEAAYINASVENKNLDSIKTFFDYDIPVCIVTNGLDLPKYVIDLANNKGIAIFRTHLSSEKFIALMTTILSDLFAPYEIFHGNFVSIYNVGVLIIGSSGIGKSESVLGLVERGHKFVADDMVKIKKMRTPHGFELKGGPCADYGPYIEIRGIGIINVSQYYGEGRLLEEERLGLVIKLAEWDQTYDYDRLGLEERYINILGMDIPYKEIPVTSGRNIPLLIEVAAYREIMRRLGYNSAVELDKKIIDFMKKDKSY